MNTSKACHQIPPSINIEGNAILSNCTTVLNSLFLPNWRDNNVTNKQQLLASLPSHKLNHSIPAEYNLRAELKGEEIQLAEKVDRVSKIMKNLGGDRMEELIMIDTIYRLGLDHHFQEEIIEILHRQYMEFYFSQLSRVNCCAKGLYEVSLRFRLLRQQGYNVSTDAFDGFPSLQDIKFNEELVMDTQTLISLFEASEMRIQGECILDEVNKLSKRVLNGSVENLNECRMLQVQNALKHPFQKSLARFTAHDFLGTLLGAKGWRVELQKLAKMEFSTTQILYKNEISHISSWWEKVGLAKELEFARDQPKKWHLWSLAMLSDPRLSEQRIEVTKAISFVYIIDDIFDVYGTPKDLSIFAEAVNRWEFETLEMPKYMSICLKGLFDVTEEISQQIWLKFNCNPKDSLRKVWTDLINAYLVESKWLIAGYMPSTTEYLSVATVTSGVHVVLAHLYFLVGGELNTYILGKELSGITSSAAMILRLWDDLGTSKDEGQDGHDGSYIKCYINEHEDISIDDAREHVNELISDAWKSLNQESMISFPYPFSSWKIFTKGCLNLARMVPLMYSYDENQKLPDLDKFITSLLYEKY